MTDSDRAHENAAGMYLLGMVTVSVGVGGITGSIWWGLLALGATLMATAVAGVIAVGMSGGTP